MKLKNFLLKLWSHWQGLSALAAAVMLFWFSPYLIHWLDPTAGTFDAGYLQRPVVAFVYLLFGTFAAFFALQINFPSIDRWLDEDYFYTEWKIRLTPFQRILLTGAIYFAFMAAYIACLFAVPV